MQVLPRPNQGQVADAEPPLARRALARLALELLEQVAHLQALVLPREAGVQVGVVHLRDARGPAAVQEHDVAVLPRHTLHRLSEVGGVDVAEQQAPPVVFAGLASQRPFQVSQDVLQTVAPGVRHLHSDPRWRVGFHCLLQARQDSWTPLEEHFEVRQCTRLLRAADHHCAGGPAGAGLRVQLLQRDHPRAPVGQGPGVLRARLVEVERFLVEPAGAWIVAVPQRTPGARAGHLAGTRI